MGKYWFKDDILKSTGIGRTEIRKSSTNLVKLLVLLAKQIAWTGTAECETVSAVWGVYYCLHDSLKKKNK